MAIDPRTIPTFTDQLWSNEVGLVDPEANTPSPGGTYIFSNGRTRTDNSLYDPRLPEEPAP
jgi:hypothetical protein